MKEKIKKDINICNKCKYFIKKIYKGEFYCRCLVRYEYIDDITSCSEVFNAFNISYISFNKIHEFINRKLPQNCFYLFEQIVSDDKNDC